MRPSPLPEKILVIGGTGHTGSRLVRRLVELGQRPRVLTREPTKLPKPLRQQVEMWRGGLEDWRDEAPPSAEELEAFAGIEAVISLAHVKFAPRILAAMKASGAGRGIFMSSTRRYTKYPEETARQVIAGEDAIRASGLDWTIVRATLIYGGAEDNNLEHAIRLLKRWPAWLPFPMPGGGRMLWQPVFTWDVVAALLAAAERPESSGRDYTVSGPRPISAAEMTRVMWRALGRRDPLLVSLPLGAFRLAARASEKLQSKPRMKLDQARRLEEDKDIGHEDAARDLGFAPMAFEEGIRRKLAGEA